jgi:hypothetical protein
MSTEWVGIDLDGTLANYDGWKGVEYIGAPIPEMVRKVKSMLCFGLTVKIFTARVCDPDPRVVPIIHKWLIEEAGLPVLEVTNIKDFGMLRLYDDRCKEVVPNTGLTIQEYMEEGEKK